MSILSPTVAGPNLFVSEGLDLGGVASGTGLKGATDDRFDTCHWGSELALKVDLELDVGEAQPAAGRVGKEGVADRALAALLKRELALAVCSDGRCPDAQGLCLEGANLFEGLMVELSHARAEALNS